MNNVRINNELQLNYPDGFREMTEEELTKYFSSPQNRWGAYDADRHIILSVSWTKAGFFSFMTDAESKMMEVEARMCRNLLNYQRVSSFKTKIAGKKAFGVRFEYRVNDARIVQVGDLMMLKYKKKFYAFHYITRKATAVADRADFVEALKSVSLG